MPIVEAQTIENLPKTAANPVKAEFAVERQTNGKYRIGGVPIFEIHDTRGFKCDDGWMFSAVTAQQTDKGKGFLPRLIKGHTSDTPGDEKPVEAYLDNYRFDQASGWMFADYVDVPEQLMREIVEGKWPGRSVEIVPEDPAIRTVALLGGNRPFFQLPDTRFEEKRKQLVYYQEIRYMPHDAKKDEKKKEFNEGLPNDISQEEMPEFQRFMRFMKAFQGMDKTKVVENTDGNKSEDFQEDEKKDEKKKDEFSDKAGLQYSEMRKEIDVLKDRNTALEMGIEHAEWTKKYGELRAPATLLTVEKEVEYTMTLPKASRQGYYERIGKFVKGPSTDLLETKDYLAKTPESQKYQLIQDEWAKPEVKKKYTTYGNFLASKAEGK